MEPVSKYLVNLECFAQIRCTYSFYPRRGMSQHFLNPIKFFILLAFPIVAPSLRTTTNFAAFHVRNTKSNNISIVDRFLFIYCLKNFPENFIATQPLSMKIKSVASGAGFALFLTPSGSVFSKGIGTQAQVEIIIFKVEVNSAMGIQNPILTQK